MKLASLKGGRDGRLVVVSADLAWCVGAEPIAPTLQAALDDWERCEPLLRGLAESLEHGSVASARFREHEAASPLPRAYQWADGSAYVNHVALVRRARGAEMPASFWTDPLMYQGGSDGFLGPRDAIPLPDPAWGCDFEAEVAVITGPVARGASREAALAAIRLVMLANDVSLRGLIPDELAKGFGFFQSKPAGSFSPVAVTPDALGDAWARRQAQRPAAGRAQWPVVRAGRRRRGYDLRLRPAHRPRRQNARTGRRLDHRLGHGLQSWRRRRPWQEHRRWRRRLFLHRRTADRGNHQRRSADDTVSQERRHRAHRDAQRRPPLDFRGHRTDGAGRLR